MNKKLKVILIGVCIIIFTMIKFQFKIVSLENGERTVVYKLPFNSYKPGGSSGVDLRDELAAIYGKDGIQIEQYEGQWQGKNITVYDTSKYEFEHLGQSIDGGHYFSCKVFTIRSVKFDYKEKMIETERTLTYIGYDDADLSSDIRATILWGTLKDKYSDGEEYFNSFMIES